MTAKQYEAFAIKDWLIAKNRKLDPYHRIASENVMWYMLLRRAQMLIGFERGKEI